VQRQGWAVLLGAKYDLTPHWSIEPSYIHWQVSASSVDSTTATYTVHGITAREELNAIEPDNTTHEFSVSLGFHF
jgi:opacity protein-like surface antigen